MRMTRLLQCAATSLALAGCAAPGPERPAPAGTVAAVYVELAPGLYVERRLAGPAGGPAVAAVALDPPGPAGAETALVHLPRPQSVEPGQRLQLRLDTASPRRGAAVVRPGHRAIAVLPAPREDLGAATALAD